MGKYAEAAKKAANETDAEFADDIKQMMEVDLDSLFPNGSDKALVSELIKQINKSTSRNESITAYQAFAAKASVSAVQTFKEGFQIAKKLAV